MREAIRVLRVSDEASSTRRLSYRRGRKLGSQEFGREQEYRDLRIERALAGTPAAIVSGLELDPSWSDSVNAGGTFRVRAGLAIDADGIVFALREPLVVSWGSLLDEYESDERRRPDGVLADGLYLIELRRTKVVAAMPRATEPCRRDEQDPYFDERIERVAHPALVGPLPDSASLLAVDTPERAANRQCAALLNESFADLGARGVVVGLCAVRSRAPIWLDHAPVRREVGPHASAYALLAQCQQVIAARIAAVPPPSIEADRVTWAEEFARTLPIDWLPAAGQLPTGLLIDPARQPRCPLFPTTTRVELVSIRDSDAAALIHENIGRGPVQIAASDTVRLLLAVPDRDWRSDLLSRPQAALRLIDDLNRSYIEAADRWRAYREAYDRLLGIAAPKLTGDVVVEKTYTGDQGQSYKVELSRADIAALGIGWTVKSGSEISLLVDGAPIQPDDFRRKIVDAELQERGLGSSERDKLPEPYDDDFEGIGNGRYENFANWQRETHVTWGRLAVPPAPTEDGDAVRAALLRRYIALLDVEIGRQRRNADLVRDVLLTLRQKLDYHTIDLASVAGGVAGDGSGLRLVRGTTELKFAPPDAAPTGSGGGAAATTTVTPPAATVTPTMITRPVPPSAVVSPPMSSAVSPADLRSSMRNAIRNAIKLPPRGAAELMGMLVDRAPVTPPRYEAEASSFGVLSHVAPSLDTMREFDRGLREVEKLMSDQGITFDFKPTFPSNSTLSGGIAAVAGDARLYYGFVLAQGRKLVEGIAATEGNHATKDEGLRRLIAERERQVDALQDLLDGVPRQQAALTSARAAWIRASSDYAMAQRLLREDWQKVEDLDIARDHILKSATGLFYVRARGESAELPLADALILEHAVPGDVVPGCGDRHEVPEELDAFFDALLEVPLASFVRLQPLVPKLPTHRRIDVVMKHRELRLAMATTTARASDIVGSAVYRRLQPMVQASQSLLQQFMGRRPTARDSLRDYHREVVVVLSLADAATNTAGSLRETAVDLRSELERVVGCLVQRLGQIPAAVRFDWATMAEADALDCRSPATWPGMATFEGATFVAARTIVDAVRWLLDEISAPTDGNGVGALAMTTLIRAAVVLAAHGDPTTGIRGQVVTAPPVVGPGTRIRLRLDREAQLGTRLHLLDDKFAAVGEVELEDHDDLGTVARIVRVAPSTLLTRRFSVAQQ